MWQVNGSWHPGTVEKITNEFSITVSANTGDWSILDADPNYLRASVTAPGTFSQAMFTHQAFSCTLGRRPSCAYRNPSHHSDTEPYPNPNPIPNANANTNPNTDPNPNHNHNLIEP